MKIGAALPDFTQSRRPDKRPQGGAKIDLRDAEPFQQLPAETLSPKVPPPALEGAERSAPGSLTPRRGADPGPS